MDNRESPYTETLQGIQEIFAQIERTLDQAPSMEDTGLAEQGIVLGIVHGRIQKAAIELRYANGSKEALHGYLLRLIGIGIKMIQDIPKIGFTRLETIYREICEERCSQDRKFGIQNHDPITWTAIIGEEVGEAQEEIFHSVCGMQSRMPYLRVELLQTITVCVSAIQSMVRQEC